MSLVRASRFFLVVSFIFLTLINVQIFGKHVRPSFTDIDPKHQGPECCSNSTCNECLNCMYYWGCGMLTDPPTCEPCHECPTTPEPPPERTCEPCYSCPTCPPPEPCPTTIFPTCPTPTWPTCPPCTTAQPPECPPTRASPKFSQAIYQSSLPSWPTAGTNVHLGLNASTEDGSPVHYQLLTSFEFLTLSATHDIIFTTNVSDGAYVGPNNVMIIEVVASVIGDESRASSAVIIIIFPRSTAKNLENPIIL